MLAPLSLELGFLQTQSPIAHFCTKDNYLNVEKERMNQTLLKMKLDLQHIESSFIEENIMAK